MNHHRSNTEGIIANEGSVELEALLRRSNYSRLNQEGSGSSSSGSTSYEDEEDEMEWSTTMMSPNETLVTRTPSLKQRNVTTRGLYNTYVPNMDYQELCNYNTCQLGKCLPNGTCECVKPAVGKFCDQIDECLVLKCIHVSVYQINYILYIKFVRILDLSFILKLKKYNLSLWTF